MKAVAIIAEYNPFHNGHAHQIAQIKQAHPDCAIIAVMSGSLVQRGELAICSKYKRAEAAVLCGADAVLELPAVYSCAPANLFAGAAVSIIDRIGADYICFGSETADLELLKFAAAAQVKPDGQSRDKSYPASFYETFRAMHGEERARVFKGSNDILAVEYLRALRKINSGVLPIAIKRIGGDYAASAGQIRECVRAGDTARLQSLMPGASYNILADLIKSGKTADINNISAAVISHIMRLDARAVARLAETGGGLEHRVKKAGALDYQGLLAGLECKHVTSSQAKRVILNIFFGITRAEQQAPPEFTSLLCANQSGRAYLKHIRKSAQIRIVTKPADFAHDPAFAKNLLIDDICKLALFDKSGEICAVRQKPVIL